MKREKQFWKEEINIPLSCSAEEMNKLLQSLGFKEVARVFKERKTFLSGESIIALDKIKELGWFLEIEERASTKKEEKEALRKNLKLLERLKLDKSDIISEPYRDLVIKSNN
jgi:predicted adenylyl cyclase CyaB